MHTQKKSYLIARFILFFIVFLLFVWFLLQLTQLNGRYRGKFWGGCLGIFFYSITMDYKNRCRKYVKFYDKHVRINAYHNKSILKIRDIDILYEDIRAIKVKKLPIFGITGLLIDANNYGNDIKVHRFYNGFSDICETFYFKTKIFAPNARIASDFIYYLKRKNRL